MTLLTLLYSAYTAHSNGTSVVLNEHVHEKEEPKNRSNPSRYSDLDMPSSIKASSSHQVHKSLGAQGSQLGEEWSGEANFQFYYASNQHLKIGEENFSDIREAWRELRIFV